MAPRNYPVIYRIEGNKRTGRNAVAFFPHANVNFGRIECYAHIGQHSEASLAYYTGTKKPKAADAALVDELRREIVSIYQSGHDAVTLVECLKLPRDWREHAWKR